MLSHSFFFWNDIQAYIKLLLGDLHLKQNLFQFLLLYLLTKCFLPTFSRYTPTMPGRKLFAESLHSYFSEHGFDETTSSNFLDFDWLSSSRNSCEDETSDRYFSVF